VPFAALPGKEPGSYLLEEKQLVMIPQAKLLPALLEREQSPKPTVLAIGGVDYESAANNETEEPVKLAASRRAVRWNDEALFTPLPETETELDAIGKLYNQQFDLGKLQTLKGDRATEAAVKRLAPKYSHLHFATHGFFAPPEVKSALDNSDNQFQRQLSFDDQPRFTGFHPGLLSGLALAGANDPPEEGEDGIWTAEEVATMNLSNVDLAVLSACETGLGKVAGGEGLLGLQRAFQVSGAGTTVASLWQVDDAATRALMDEFYRNLWEKKLPKIEALRQAQLKMLREYDPQKGTLRGVGGVRQLDTDGKPERLPPFYWAAWVLSGDWR
jgi:CHAT domain-containing protein